MTALTAIATSSLAWVRPSSGFAAAHETPLCMAIGRGEASPMP